MDETGDKLKAAYSALAREEPPAALDAAILAASRRALARPSASRRWAGPVSIAAVLVLAFGVTLHMQQDKPGVESPDMYGGAPTYPAPEPATPPPQAPTPAGPQKAAPASEAFVPEPPMKQAKPQARNEAPKPKLDRAQPRMEEANRSLRDEPAAARERKDTAPVENERRATMQAIPAPAAPAAAPAIAPPPEPAGRAPAPAAAAAPQSAPAAPARMKREALSGFRAADAQADADEPTRELEAIAKLRAEGRHDEADKALAEFRRRRPDYRIPEAMWERVKPR